VHKVISSDLSYELHFYNIQLDLTNNENEIKTNY